MTRSTHRIPYHLLHQAPLQAIASPERWFDADSLRLAGPDCSREPCGDDHKAVRHLGHGDWDDHFFDAPDAPIVGSIPPDDRYRPAAAHAVAVLAG